MFDVRAIFAAFGARRPGERGPLERGAAELAAHRPAAALACFEESLRAAASAAERSRAHNKRGVALVALGRRDDGLAAFCAALAEDDRSAPALTNIGNLLLEDGHVRDALDYYEGALRADDAYALAHRNRAAALRALGRRGDAVRALKAAAKREGRRRRPRA
jgi:tetratricopeptide (TPR) repeat protein